MRAIALCLALLSGSASADMEARQGADVLRLTQSPCHPAVLAVIPEGHRGPFRLATATVNGTTYAACWALRVDGLIMVIYPDGESGLIPIALFRQIGDL